MLHSCRSVPLNPSYESAPKSIYTITTGCSQKLSKELSGVSFLRRFCQVPGHVLDEVPYRTLIVIWRKWTALKMAGFKRHL